MKTALVHDWFVTMAGAELVVLQLLKAHPEANLFSLINFLDEGGRAELGNRPISTSFLQKMPFARKRYRGYLPFMPMAVEQLDVSGHELVISSSAAMSKGVITGPDQLHISYVHSPVRYAWDLQHQYLRESGLTKGLKGMLARALLHYIRLWDARTGNGPDILVANSQYIRRRIRKVYGRDCLVIYPPVRTKDFAPAAQREDYYLTASRMVPYKHIPMIVEAFAKMPDKKLIVVGSGPEFEKAQRAATPNVEILGYQPFDRLKDLMSKAKASVFAAEEDFGITMAEAQASGAPVIAFGRGGAAEIVKGVEEDTPTGVLYETQSPDAIIAAVEKFETMRAEDAGCFSVQACQTNAERFSEATFQRRWAYLLKRADDLRERSPHTLTEVAEHMP